MTNVAIFCVLLFVGCSLAFPAEHIERSETDHGVSREKRAAEMAAETATISPNPTTESTMPAEEENQQPSPGPVTPVPTWAIPADAGIGEIGGVAVDPDGNPHAFHRANRQFSSTSFDENNQLRNRYPINEDTVAKLCPLTGQVMDSWGAGKFYMPQGFYIDNHGNYWFTDIGLHQVLKFSPDHKLLQTWGEAFVPGNDSEHFCQPTSVAVAWDGTFFVTDGLCNSRVMKFDAAGKFVGEFGNLTVPISISVLEMHDAFELVDIGTGRVLGGDAHLSGLFDTQLWDILRIYEIGYAGKPYAMASSSSDNLMYGVSVRYNETSGVVTSTGFTMVPSLVTDIVATWQPMEGFVWPSSVAVSADGVEIYVGERYNGKMYKFLRYEFDDKEDNDS